MALENWVSQSEAARLEKDAGRPVNQSSISRFLTANADIPVKRGPNGKITLVEYLALAKAREGSLGVQDKLALKDTAPAGKTAEATLDTTDAARKRRADAQMAELDLAERLREVVSADAVTQAIEAAGATFVQGLERRRRKLAQAVSGLPDVRTIELEIKKSDRELLEKLVKALQSAASGEPVDLEADSAGETDSSPAADPAEA